MPSENELIVATGVYGGHSARGNYDVELKLVFTEQHLNEAIQFVAGIGKRLRVIAFIEDEPETKIRLGIWNVYRIAVDRNAQTIVVLKSNMDSVFVDNIPKLMVEEQEFIFKAQISQ